MRIAEEIIGRLRRATDAGDFRDAMRLDRELVAGFDDRRRDRVVAATRTERRNLALIIAMGETELILLQGRMMELRLRDIGHFGSALRAVCDSSYYLIDCQMPT